MYGSKSTLTAKKLAIARNKWAVFEKRVSSENSRRKSTPFDRLVNRYIFRVFGPLKSSLARAMPIRSGGVFSTRFFSRMSALKLCRGKMFNIQSEASTGIIVIDLSESACFGAESDVSQAISARIFPATTDFGP